MIQPLVEKNANRPRARAGCRRHARRSDQGAPGPVQSLVQRGEVHPEGTVSLPVQRMDGSEWIVGSRRPTPASV